MKQWERDRDRDRDSAREGSSYEVEVTKCARALAVAAKRLTREGSEICPARGLSEVVDRCVFRECHHESGGEAFPWRRHMRHRILARCHSPLTFLFLQRKVGRCREEFKPRWMIVLVFRSCRVAEGSAGDDGADGRAVQSRPSLQLHTSCGSNILLP